MKINRMILLSIAAVAAYVPCAGADVTPLRGKEQTFSAYHLHPYPICFYDTEQGAVASARELWKSYPSVLTDTVNLKRRQQTEISIPNSRIALVRTTLNHHRELLNIWPDVACVGRSGGATSAQAAQVCRTYIREYIHAQIAHKEMSENLVEPICQTFLPE